MNKLVLFLFKFGSRVAKATGLANVLRATIGPAIGRTAYRMSGVGDEPVTVQGHRMILASSGRYPPLAMANGSYEIGTTRLFGRLVQPGMTVVDAGAHVGYYTLEAAARVGPNGRVYAFEPEPENYGLLLRNIELNGLHNVVAVNQALSNQTGQTTLYLTQLDTGRHSTYRPDMPPRGELHVPTTTMDEFLETQGWPKVDVVKIDVEGAEGDVLEGMSLLMHRSEDLSLIVEFNPVLLRKADVDPLEFLKKPASLGFKSYWITEETDPQPLEESNDASLVDNLLATEGSVNMYWTKG